LIQITRLLAKQLRSVIKKAIGHNLPSPVLTVRSGDDGLFVEAQGANHAVQYHDPHPQDPQPQDRDLMLIPLHVFADVQGAQVEPVFLTRPRPGVLAASWDDKGVCREMEYDELEPVPDAKPFPTLPAQLVENQPELIRALRDAYETTDVGNVRYALHGIQLRADGVITATDGRQLLRQSGFQFPVEGEALVQHTKFFSCKELPADQPVHVGRDDNYVVFQFGPWTHWVAIQKEGRFPNVDQIIPPTHSAKCTLQLAAPDAKFLLKNMHRMPNGTTHRELTLDLNGSVVLRAASVNTPRPVEMILRNSSKQGDDVRICTDRKFLARAAEMGFSDFYLPHDASPALAIDVSRTYLWMLLDHQEALKPSDNCLRIESPLGSYPFCSSPTTPQKVTPVNRIASPPGQKPGQKPEPSQPAAHPAAQLAAQQPLTTNEPVVRRRQQSGREQASGSLEQAISLRDQLRAAVTSSKELIRSLKTEKRSHKSWKIALGSLQQLQAVA
jgi:hypothetical protein